MSKKLLMNNYIDNNNESWDYEWYATSGEIPSHNGSDLGKITMNFIDDYMQVFVATNSGYARFLMGDKTTSTNAIIETMVCANRKFSVNNGIRVQLSNGTFGEQVRISSYNEYGLKIEKLYGKSTTNRKRIRYLNLNTFCKIRLELNGNSGKIYIDDELVNTSNTNLSDTENDVSYAEGCYTTTHGVLFQDNSVLGCIKYIKFKEF